MAIIKYEMENDVTFETNVAIKQEDDIIKILQHDKIDDSKNKVLLTREQVKELYLKLYNE